MNVNFQFACRQPEHGYILDLRLALLYILRYTELFEGVAFLRSALLIDGVLAR
mgnify:FL=1